MQEGLHTRLSQYPGTGTSRRKLAAALHVVLWRERLPSSCFTAQPPAKGQRGNNGVSLYYSIVMTKAKLGLHEPCRITIPEVSTLVSFRLSPASPSRLFGPRFPRSSEPWLTRGIKGSLLVFASSQYYYSAAANTVKRAWLVSRFHAEHILRRINWRRWSESQRAMATCSIHSV